MGEAMGLGRAMGRAYLDGVDFLGHNNKILVFNWSGQTHFEEFVLSDKIS